MSKKWKPFLIIFILLNVLALLLIYPEGRLKGPGSHFFEGQCRKCHLNEPKQGVTALLVRNINRLCEECHKAAGGDLSHPSGVRPSFSLPADMKLDWSGKMTCITCHRAHGTDRYLLVGEAGGKVFCMRCHRESLPAKNKHGNGITAALRRQPHYEIKNLNERLDKESIACLSCHDGSFSKYQYVKVGAGIWNHAEGIGLSHPVGTDYGNALRKGGYKPLARLNKKIRLFNGRLGCSSCHNRHSAIAKRLVISDSGSALCLECHVR